MKYVKDQKITVEGVNCTITSAEYDNTIIVETESGELAQVKKGKKLLFTLSDRKMKDYSIKFSNSKRKRNVAIRLKNLG